MLNCVMGLTMYSLPFTNALDLSLGDFALATLYFPKEMHKEGNGHYLLGV